MSGVKTAQFDITDVRLTHTIYGGCVTTTMPVFNIAVRTILHHLHQHNTVMTHLLDGLIHISFWSLYIIMYKHEYAHTHNIIIFIYLLPLMFCEFIYTSY